MHKNSKQMIKIWIQFKLNRIHLSFAVQSPGNHQFRTLSLNQRLLETTPYLRDLEPLRRKSLSQLNSNSLNSTLNMHTKQEPSNAPIIDFDYKPNVPQIQGKESHLS